MGGIPSDYFVSTQLQVVLLFVLWLLLGCDKNLTCKFAKFEKNHIEAECNDEYTESLDDNANSYTMKIQDQLSLRLK